MRQMVLQYRDLRIAVAAVDESDLIWLEDFLGPSYTRIEDADAESNCRVQLCVDPDWDERRQSWQQHEAGGTLQRVLAHVLDGTDLYLPCLRQSDGKLLAWSDQFGCFYHQDREGVVSVLQQQGLPRSRRPRFVLMRAVREYALHQELRNSTLALHASGVVREGKAILFAGPRRAGKTTLLSACLSLVPELQLLANDRVMVCRHGRSWRCRGMATAVSVRPGDEKLLPGLRQRLQVQALGPEAAPGEPRARTFPTEGRLMMSPSQFCRGLGVSMAAESGLASVLLPRIDPSVAGMRWQQLSPTSAAPALMAVLFGAAHPGSRSELFDTEKNDVFPSPAVQRTMVQQLAREVPCFQIVVGAESYRPEVLSSLLEMALAH